MGCLLMQAQEQKPWVLKALHAVKTYIDSSAVKGIDPKYLEVPEKPWALVIKTNVNDMNMRSTTKMTEEQLVRHNVIGEINFESKFKPDRELSIGAWIGYRGYGFGYSYSLQRSKGRNFSIGATGANYGFNLRTRSFNTDELAAHYWGNDGEGTTDEWMENALTWDAIKIKSAIFDALIQFLGDVGRFKIHKGSIGVGYAYNWVPMRNLLVNVMAMPMLTVYNRTKLYYYESNYNIFMEEGDVSHDGRKVVPDDDSWTEDITLKESGTETKYGRPSLSMDARASITYQLNRYFLCISGQYNRYSNKVDNNELELTDWYVNASLGVRF